MIRAALFTLAMATPAMAQQLPDALPLPFNLGGTYSLTDQDGETRTQVDPDGKPQLLFFGYANCQQICSAALPMMAEVARDLARQGLEVRPVMITVDPTRDTPENIGPALREHHEDFVGLTGTEEELQVAYDAFSVEKEEIFFDPEFGPVFSHGSFIYLLDGDGAFLTLVPPIVSPETAAGIVSKYTKDLS